MPKGLKPTSQLISIGFGLTESGANTFTQGQIDLQLNVLDREVFVVQAIDLDVLPPDNLMGTNTQIEASVTSTSRTAVGSLSQSPTLAVKKVFCRSGNATSPGVGYESGSMETPPTSMEYLGIIATNDFFVQIEGTSNAAAKGTAGKMYGYRAQADADTFAALTQSELLSAQ